MKIYYINSDKCLDLTPNLKNVITDEKLIKWGITLIVIYKATSGNVLYAYDGISTAVKPIVDVVVDAAEPISYGFMAKGFIQWMSGSEHEAKKTIKSSIVGFLGIQFMPQIYKIIRTIKL